MIRFSTWISENKMKNFTLSLSFKFEKGLNKSKFISIQKSNFTDRKFRVRLKNCSVYSITRIKLNRHNVKSDIQIYEPNGPLSKTLCLKHELEVCTGQTFQARAEREILISIRAWPEREI